MAKRSDSVSIRIEGRKSVERAINDLEKQFPKDAQKAINRTAQRSATRVRRNLSQAVGLPQKVLKKRVMHYKASKHSPAASVWIGTKSGIPLAEVSGARSTLSGVLKAGRVRVQTFRAKMPSGYVGQFVRTPGATRKTRSDGQSTELPIEEPRVRLAGPGRPIIIRVTVEQVSTFYPRELRRLAALSIKRTAKKARRRRNTPNTIR